MPEHGHLVKRFLHINEINVSVKVGVTGAASVSYDGVLGMNVLSKYLVVIDGPEGVLYLAE